MPEVIKEPTKEEMRADIRRRIVRNYTYHAPKDDQAARYDKIRSQAMTVAHEFTNLDEAIDELQTVIQECVPECDERIQALGNLQQLRSGMLGALTTLTILDAIVMFSNAAIARNE